MPCRRVSSLARRAHHLSVSNEVENDVELGSWLSCEIDAVPQFPPKSGRYYIISAM